MTSSNRLRSVRSQRVLDNRSINKETLDSIKATVDRCAGVFLFNTPGTDVSLNGQAVLGSLAQPGQARAGSCTGLRLYRLDFPSLLRSS